MRLREEVVHSGRQKGKGKEVTHSLPLSMYSAPGGLRQDPGRVAESPAEARTCGNQGAKYVCLSTYEPCGTSNRRWDSRCGCGHSARRSGCAPPDCAEQLAEMQPCGTGVS
jgi:hypothetical protein